MATVVRIHSQLIVAGDGTGTITIQVPPEVAQGEHKAISIIWIDSQSTEGIRPSKVEFSAHDIGPLPEGVTYSRDQIYDDDGR